LLAAIPVLDGLLNPIEYQGFDFLCVLALLLGLDFED
jgi:hypothetical protein